MKRTLIFNSNFFLILLSCLAIFLSFLSRKNYKLYEASRFEIEALVSQKLEYNTRSEARLFTDEMEVNDLYVMGINDDSISLRSQLSSPKLLFWFSNEFCRACIEDVIENLNILGEQIGYENIIILSDHDNARLLRVFINNYEIKSPCFFSSKKLNLTIEEPPKNGKLPFFLFIDDRYKVHLSFYADENAELIEQYLNRVIQLFNSMQKVN